MDILAYIASLAMQTIFRKANASMSYRNIFEIDYGKLSKLGISHLIFDIDDTIADDNMPIKKEVQLFLKKLSKQFKISFLSNSCKNKEEIMKFAVRNKMKIILKARKPNPKNLIMLVKPEENAAIIGDRGIDIWTGYNAGVNNRILIVPYGNKASIIIKILRFIENSITKVN